MQISSKEAHSFSLLREGKECARKKKLKWILQDSNLKCLDEKLRRGDITLAEFISTASYRVASDIVDADEDEDMEDDPELISLNESEEEEASENELTGSLNELMNDEKFQSYRTNKIVLNVNGIDDCPSAGFVMEQLAELEADLTEAEEACEDSDSTLCWNCDQYKATRITKHSMWTLGGLHQLHHSACQHATTLCLNINKWRTRRRRANSFAMQVPILPMHCGQILPCLLRIIILYFYRFFF
ncbi:uncharacterized protein LOC120355606 [Nilaparvata lugens]|uniref:uncharacterized protein LOC120355606 n=1 Tax=Nilaparvata lugens TaxID=108931 RepID=UPI00193E60B6|nr:uncharacterized protein LOC120355606 [Nilaparvata lugens]